MGLLRGFSVGAVMKRMCKAVLKKGLGEFFLGELDLDQLDLQLTRGTLELTDLALNAEFINAQVRPDSPLSLSLSRVGLVRALIVFRVRSIRRGGMGFRSHPVAISQSPRADC
jgi:autophagy-related protein 2